MFIVKWVNTLGIERLYEARRVEFTNPVGANSQSSVFITTADGENWVFDVGRVYVMTTEGRTIDTYKLEGDPYGPAKPLEEQHS